MREKSAFSKRLKIEMRTPPENIRFYAVFSGGDLAVLEKIFEKPYFESHRIEASGFCSHKRF